MCLGAHGHTHVYAQKGVFPSCKSLGLGLYLSLASLVQVAKGGEGAGTGSRPGGDSFNISFSPSLGLTTHYVPDTVLTHSFLPATLEFRYSYDPSLTGKEPEAQGGPATCLRSHSGGSGGTGFELTPALER